MQEMTARARTWTWIGLAIALFGLPLIVFVYRLVVSDPGAGGAVAVRELLILALVAFLLWIVRSREGLPLSSIGIGPAGLWRSLAWGLACFVLVVAGLAACLGLFAVLGVHYGEGGSVSVSLWATALTVARAGVAEEVFYRGYAIERLEALTGKTWIAALVSLIFFAAFHYRQGWPGVLIALVVGAILTGFYLWKRNLVANIIAHFTIDFIPNVLLPLVAGSQAPG